MKVDINHIHENERCESWQTCDYVYEVDDMTILWLSLFMSDVDCMMIYTFTDEWLSLNHSNSMLHKL